MDGLIFEIKTLVFGIRDFLPKAVVGSILFFVIWLFACLVNSGIRKFAVTAVRGRKSVFFLAGKTIKTILVIMGLLMAFGKMGIDVTAMVASLGLTGFAIGFALKDILSNVLCGVLILIYRPFKIHDKIATGGMEGVVTEIDLRYTTLQADGKRILIPNSSLFTTAIHVFDAEKMVAK